MKGGAHSFPFAALSFPDSKKGTHLLLGWQKDFSSRRIAKLSLDLRSITERVSNLSTTAPVLVTQFPFR